MRSRAVHAAAVMALFLLGQLFALGHEARARHVVCAEHGEQVEAQALGGHDDGCGQSHLLSLEGGGAAGHEHCEIARMLHTSARPSHGPDFHIAAIAIAAVQTFVSTERPRTVDIIVIAPKTSPPIV